MSHNASGALAPYITEHTPAFSAAGSNKQLVIKGFGLGLSAVVEIPSNLGMETSRAFTKTGPTAGVLTITLTVESFTESTNRTIAISMGGVPAQGVGVTAGAITVVHGFQPTNLTSLVGWYDAGDEDTLTRDASDLVGQWDDKSGNGFHLAQSTTSKKPKYFASGGGIGQAHIRLGYDGTRHNMLIGSNETWATYDGSSLKMSTFVVFHWPGVGGADWSDVIRYNNNIQAAVHKDYGPAFWFGAWYATGGAASNLPTKVLGGWFFTDSGSVVRVNGAVRSSNSAQPAQSDQVDDWILGMHYGGAWPNLEVSEILIFKDELTGSDLTNIEAYLNNKWSIY